MLGFQKMVNFSQKPSPQNLLRLKKKTGGQFFFEVPYPL